ncbi:MAG: hypothetical protein KDB03_22535 [Planctomycetales bacterium]|nr:hypothetical protein [Planctomycetales bacterium]
MKIRAWTWLLLGTAINPLIVNVSDLSAGERPTLNVTRDPRPDILPHPIYDSYVEYRRAYNRPRFWSGWIAYKIEPTSQEAMVWCENYREGRYEKKHMPPVYKRYFAPKPWEVLPIGPRPDFPAEDNLPELQAADGAPLQFATSLQIADEQSIRNYQSQ